MNFYFNQEIKEYKYWYVQIMDGQVIIQQPENYKMYQLDEKFKVRGGDSIQFALQSSFNFHTPRSDQCVFTKKETIYNQKLFQLEKGELQKQEKKEGQEKIYFQGVQV
ncbi:hypothetical protein ABPG74_019853 [Tetrahymena malaccensis]